MDAKANILNFKNRRIPEDALGFHAGRLGAAAKSPKPLNYRGEMEWSNGFEAKQLRVAMAKTHHALPGRKMVESSRELNKFWPLYREYGYVALSTAYTTLSGYDDDGPTFPEEHAKAFVLDTLTYVGTINKHEQFMSQVEETAEEVCRRWNEKNAGGKNLGTRQEEQESFDLISVVWLTPKGEPRISTIVIQVSCYLANTDKINDPHATMGVDDCHVNFKMMKGVSLTTRRPSVCGVQIGIPALREFVSCPTMREAVSEASDFIAGLDLTDEDFLRCRIVPDGRDKEEFAKEYRAEVFSKKRKKAAEGEGPRSKQSAV